MNNKNNKNNKQYLIDLVKNMFNIPFQKNYNKYYIPKNLFGIFASIHRERIDLQNASNNDKVHGCIGYWNLEGMTREEIIEKGFDVSNSACWNDRRSTHFEEPINYDPDASLQIYFMKKPIYEINSENGRINELNRNFDNDNFGVIVENQETGNRATYLPGVFPKSKFLNIKNSIINKASITNNNLELNKFYAYQCDIVEIKFIDILSKSQILQNMNNFINLINYFYKFNNKNKNNNFIPYELTSNNKVVIDKDQNVRNVATIYDYLYFSKIVKRLPDKDSELYKKIVENIEYYIEKYKNNDDMRQAASFLFLILNLSRKDEYINKNATEPSNAFYKNENIKYLNEVGSYESRIKNYSTNNFNQDFELPQILIMLTAIMPDYEITIEYLYLFYERLNSNSNGMKNIFFYNWFAKYFYEVLINDAINIMVYKQFLYQICEKLSKKMLNIVKRFKEEETETNYYAVSFEGLSALYFCMSSLMNQDHEYEDRNYINNFKNNMKEIKKYIFYLYLQLGKRLNQKNMTLYKFRDGSCRFDITTHVLYGESYLLYVL